MQEQNMVEAVDQQKKTLAHDMAYDHWRATVYQNIQALSPDTQLFRTGVGREVFATYLAAMPESFRQQYNCSCCRNFMRDYGDLVKINEDGTLTSVVWRNVPETLEHNGGPNPFYAVAQAQAALVEKSAILKPYFLKSHDNWGFGEKGGYSHFWASTAHLRVFNKYKKTAGAAMLDGIADFETFKRALSEYRLDSARQAHELLVTGAFNRNERFIGPVNHLIKTHESLEATKNERIKDNLIWNAMYSGPIDWSKPRGTVIGQLIEAIQAGKTLSEVKALFNELTHGLNYQRPTEAPKASQVDAAEKIFAELNLGPALPRRFAGLADMTHRLWESAEEVKVEAPGLFGGMKTRDSKESDTFPKLENTNPIDISLRKFRETILPEVKSMKAGVTMRDDFVGFITAVDPDAPGLFHYDLGEVRVPVSYYRYQGLSNAQSWGIEAGFREVACAVNSPENWVSGKPGKDGEAFILILTEGRDSMMERSGQTPIFPENFRPELRDIRGVVAEYAKTHGLEPYVGHQAFGVLLGHSEGNQIKRVVRVTMKNDAVRYYRVTTWD
jgi:hypothetical protein